jgi:hypothetical protein
MTFKLYYFVNSQEIANASIVDPTVVYLQLTCPGGFVGGFLFNDKLGRRSLPSWGCAGSWMGVCQQTEKHMNDSRSYVGSYVKYTYDTLSSFRRPMQFGSRSYWYGLTVRFTRWYLLLYSTYRTGGWNTRRHHTGQNLHPREEAASSERMSATKIERRQYNIYI